MQFIHPAITWGFLLALAPLLIHLINLLRQQRVQWAAMEFLLQSYRKQRQWIWLKQLLLLLARMAAMILAVAMLAQLKSREQWLSLFGGQTTHHYVILDDSYSMSQRAAGASAFDAAKHVLRAIAAQAKAADSPQKMTLLRYSQARAAAAPGSDSLAGRIADFSAEPIDGAFDLTLEKRQQTWEPTSLALGPRESLAAVKQLLAQNREETSVVYLLSDFRAKEWSNPAEPRALLEEIKKSKASIQLIDCSKSQEPNLGIVELAPADETRAAGVPLFVNVKIKNHGPRAVSKVQLRLRSAFYPRPTDAARRDPAKLAAEYDELATLLIDQIGPGETISRRVQAYFVAPGKHLVEARLPDDPVTVDNQRWCVIDFPDGEKALLIDGSVDQQNAYYLEAAFRPLEKSNTGVRPEVKPAAFLRDAAADALKVYSTIYLLDAPRLDDRAVTTLEEYVRGGGGLAIFAGPNINAPFYSNRFYAAGQGLFPAPVVGPYDLPPAADAAQPDLELAKHPLFSFFLDQANPLIRGVKVDRYLRLKDGWKPEPGSGVAIIASLRNGAPFMIEKRYGAGTVVACLSTLAPQWNDWAKNPSIVVLALKLQSHLASARRLDDPRLVGSTLDIPLEASRFLPEMCFTTPGEGAAPRIKIDRVAAPRDDAGAMLSASLGLRRAADHLTGETDRPGVYEAWATLAKGDLEVRRWAFNVAPEEGDLSTVSSADLIARLDPVKVAYHQADQYQQEESSAAGYNLSHFLMLGLLGLLASEQLLAYSASYHTKPGAAR